MTTTLHTSQAAQALKKCPTGIQGLDDVTFGGLPLGRTALVCGAAGCGKTLLAMQFLVNLAYVHYLIPLFYVPSCAVFFVG